MHQNAIYIYVFRYSKIPGFLVKKCCWQHNPSWCPVLHICFVSIFIIVGYVWHILEKEEGDFCPPPSMREELWIESPWIGSMPNALLQNGRNHTHTHTHARTHTHTHTHTYTQHTQHTHTHTRRDTYAYIPQI